MLNRSPEGADMKKTVIVVTCCVLAGSLLAGCHGSSSSPTPSVRPASSRSAPPPAPQTVAAATTAGYPATASAPAPAKPASAKLSPELVAVSRRIRSAPDATAARALSNKRVHVNAQGQIQVYIYVKQVSAAMETRLNQAGARVERGVSTMKVYQAWAGPDALVRISKLPDVVRITPPAYGFPK